MQDVVAGGAGPLLGALALAAVYALGPWLRPLGAEHPRRKVSVAAGASMAYVFLDVLPELGARHRALLESAGSLIFAEQRLYALALAGFVVLYGLDHLVLAARARADSSAGGAAERLAFRLHVGGFALYSLVIGYMLVSRREDGWSSLGLFLVAMAFHLTVVDHALAREHGSAYDTLGRWVLAASVVVGWLAGATLQIPEIAISRLFAFVAGGVVMTAANEELPREKVGRFAWFVLGAVVYGAVLLAA
jgi:hypothetical protein